MAFLHVKWVEEKMTLPPVPFTELLDATVDDKEIRSEIDKLLVLKKDGKEHDMLIVNDNLVGYARRLADYYAERVNTFRPEQNDSSSDVLDSILYDMVESHK